MTTGLLESLKKDNDLKRWLLTDVARQFGLFYSLRDEPLGHSVEELLNAVKEVDESCIKSLQADLVIPEIKESDEEILRKECKNGYIEALRKYSEAEHKLEETEILYNRFMEMYNKVPADSSDLIINLFDTAKKQMGIMLNEANDAVRWRKQEIEEFSDEDKYVENHKKYLEREKKYYIEKAERAKKQLEERESYYDTYKELIEFINKL